MIVKIQLPLMGAPEVLIYNRDRTFQTMVPIDDDILAMMRGEYKKYFKIKYESKTKNIKILKEVEIQDW